MQWQEIKTVAEVVQSCVTTLAVLVGAAWSYRLFVRKRQPFPRARIEHRVRHHPLGGGRVLVSVTVIMVNTGETLLRLSRGETTIRRVLPLSAGALATASQDALPSRDLTVGWPVLARESEAWGGEPLEIEPGNRDELHYFFPIPAEAQVVLVRTFFENSRRRDEGTGWNVTTVYDLRCSALQLGQEEQPCGGE